LVTHEHSDHTCGLTALAKASRRGIPVYLTHGSAEFIDWGEHVPVVQHFQAGSCFTIGDFDVTSFTIPHDAADPVGYTLTADGVKVAVATDLGYVPDSLRIHLRVADLL